MVDRVTQRLLAAIDDWKDVHGRQDSKALARLDDAARELSDPDKDSPETPGQKAARDAERNRREQKQQDAKTKTSDARDNADQPAWVTAQEGNEGNDG